MDNQEDQNFIFGGEDSEPEFHDALAMQRIEKLSHKLSFISFLIPCLIGIVIIFIYLDIKNKVAQVHTSGSTEIHAITVNLEKSISALQLKNTEIEKLLKNKTSQMEKTLSTINRKLKKAEKNINFLTSSKSDKKKIAPTIKALKTESESLRKSFTDLSTQNKKLIDIAQELQSRTEEMSTLKSTIEQLEKNITNIQNNKLDTDELNNSLKKQKIFYQIELKELSKKIDHKIEKLKSASNKNTGPSTTPPASN